MLAEAPHTYRGWLEGGHGLLWLIPILIHVLLLAGVFALTVDLNFLLRDNALALLQDAGNLVNLVVGCLVLVGVDTAASEKYFHIVRVPRSKSHQLSEQKRNDVQINMLLL